MDCSLAAIQWRLDRFLSKDARGALIAALGKAALSGPFKGSLIAATKWLIYTFHHFNGYVIDIVHVRARVFAEFKTSTVHTQSGAAAAMRRICSPDGVTTPRDGEIQLQSPSPNTDSGGSGPGLKVTSLQQPRRTAPTRLIAGLRCVCE